MSAATATAAVAIIETKEPERCFLLLRRASHPNDPWSGHFSFPGGRREKSDKSLMATCIRETREETGIHLREENLQQTLAPEPAGRNYNTPLLVQPYLFTIKTKPKLTIDTREIQRGIWLRAKQFQEASLHQELEMIPGKYFAVFPIDDYYLWGFTYRLLHTIIPPIMA